MHVHPSADSRRCIVPGFLNLCLVEIVLPADPARAVYVQSPMHGVHTWPKVLVWTPETLRASQSERDTSVPCCLYLSEDSNALAYISRGRGRRGQQAHDQKKKRDIESSYIVFYYMIFYDIILHDFA